MPETLKVLSVPRGCQTPTPRRSRFIVGGVRFPSDAEAEKAPAAYSQVRQELVCAGPRRQSSSRDGGTDSVSNFQRYDRNRDDTRCPVGKFWIGKKVQRSGGGL